MVSMTHHQLASHADMSLQTLIEESLETLELPGVLQEVAAHAYSAPGKAEVLAAVPESDPDRISSNLDVVTELRDLEGISGPLGFGDLAPMEGILSRLDNPAAILDAEEILAVKDLLEIAQIVRDRLLRLEERFEHLRRVAGEFRPFDHVVKRIANVLDEHGVVRSSASPVLQDIRRGMRSIRSRITRELAAVVDDKDLSRIVHEDYVTMRNDRYVILLRPEFKGLLDGIVHDHSRSGASVYVEPFHVVELNNKVATLADEEREEIRKIFADLTEEIRTDLPDIIEDYGILVWLDSYQARALYAIRMNAVRPILVDQGFRLLGARHPLLPESGDDAVVPVDVVQDPTTLATVISGANMGGKTVALKIAGLFPLMTRCAIMLPALEGAEVRVFPRIMANIGDEQDIRGKVSSFSGHVLRIKATLEHAVPGDLVLLDELGGATDPEEGSALAMAILDELVGGECNVVVTTHLTLLKAYGMGSPGVKNVSVEFHPETLKPTYQLIYDLPGESHAIATAARIGVSPRVIERARGYMDSAAGGSSRLLQRLRRELTGLEDQRRELKEQSEALDKELEEVRNSRGQVVEQFRREARDLLKLAARQISDLQKSLKSGSLKSGSKPRQVLDRIKDEVVEKLGTPLERTLPTIQVGARVRIESLGREGRVQELLDKGRVEVVLGNVKTRVSIEELLVLDPGPGEKSSLKNEQIRIDIPIATPQREVRVIGLRVDDALPVVDKALDEALLGGLHELSIVHGKGTGRLRKAIWDYLAENSLVQSFHAAGIHGGGEGVTVVELPSDK
jgi:DNA mismatch repair protein MutS2